MKHRHYLTPLFEPRSVAVVGASEDRTKVGGRVLENLIQSGFRGRLYAVNPRHAQLSGIACFPCIEKLPERVDLVVIATPAPTVPDIIAECGRKGVGFAVVITAGFSEAGPAGVELERKLIETARGAKVRFLGPNCIGLMRPPLGLNATFARGTGIPGSIALVAQSGAVCSAMLDWATPNGIGFSSMISLGGSSDLDFGEVIDYLAADEKTEHILLYIEGVKDGRRLVGSLRAASRAKPVIVMKVGRHPGGLRAAVSHTGAIVGKDDIFDAVVRRTGVVRVQALGELVSAARALASHVHPAGERLAIITNGGGPGVMAADRAGDLGIPLATLGSPTFARLSRALPPTWSHGNPIDLIGDAGPDRYREAVAACIDDPGVDGIVTILTPQAMTEADKAAAAVVEAAHGSSKPVIACWMGKTSVTSAREYLRAAGHAVFPVPETAVEAFSHVASFYRHQRALLETPGPLAHTEAPDLPTARALIAKAIAERRRVLSATESKALLSAFRIPVARSVVARSEDEAVRLAAEVCYPVAMKIDSPDITHKGDVGGVKLSLGDADAVRAAYREMMTRVARARPDARVSGVSLEAMVPRTHARELMAGIVNDAIFGPAVTFGAGGIAIEVLHDRAVALPPLNAALVEDMIRGTRVAKMLGDFRSLPAVDRKALDAVLLRVSEIACEMPEIEELDINPLMAHENGVIAVDARVVLRERIAARRAYEHLSIHPYPADLVSKVRLAGGQEIGLRPIRPEDANIEAEFVARLSEESRRRRFMSGLRDLTPAMLARFTQIDYDREMALIATCEEGGREIEIGVCRYITLPDGASCEFAIVVDDKWQHRGLGPAMMRQLIEVARRRRLKTMTGWIVADNAPMLRMCAALGFRMSADPEDSSVRVATLDIAAATIPERVLTIG